MTFIQAIALWLDAEGLVGSSPNPGKWSTGNAILETAIALLIDYDLGPSSGSQDESYAIVSKMFNAIKMCQRPSGIFDKNLGRPDEITHDDIIGAVAISAILDRSVAQNLVQYGEDNYWVLSNTGIPYFTAHAKPWHKTFYQIAADKKTSMFDRLILAASWVFPSDASGMRLEWLQIRAVAKTSTLLQFGEMLWWLKFRRTYGSIANLMLDYYKDENHPFYVYLKGVM